MVNERKLALHAKLETYYEALEILRENANIFSPDDYTEIENRIKYNIEQIINDNESSK